MCENSTPVKIVTQTQNQIGEDKYVDVKETRKSM